MLCQSLHPPTLHGLTRPACSSTRTTRPWANCQRRLYLCRSQPNDYTQDSSSFSMGFASPCTSNQQPVEPTPPIQREVVQENSDSSQVVNSLQVLSSATGFQTSNTTVLANDNSEETWRKLDKRVNKYPGEREFTVIGTGSDFKESMVSATESIVGSVHEENVLERKSRNGKYSSVKIVAYIEEGEQVLQIYHSMRRDPRMRWFI